MNILILCTGNSARSILGEAAFNHLGQGRVTAFSAGSHPSGRPNPLALALLRDKGIDNAFARSKSWDEFAAPDAPIMDLVITVCDSAAAETCPFWPGAPLRAHWGLPDPHTPEDFARTWEALTTRVRAFLALPDGADLKAELPRIGTL